MVKRFDINDLQEYVPDNGMRLLSFACIVATMSLIVWKIVNYKIRMDSSSMVSECLLRFLFLRRRVKRSFDE
ncbi:hypothetical protein CEXT_96961 [Caerostris extrusa]|uniref:Uncharacterized protein n=1 Tax=Caerostris extrusa TaxID=172846 RepID=A0AAV4NRF3_CAEEX|nr:hypothetical protein CEXT_96961 [Caerostris extrusa]